MLLSIKAKAFCIKSNTPKEGGSICRNDTEKGGSTCAGMTVKLLKRVGQHDRNPRVNMLRNWWVKMTGIVSQFQVRTVPIAL